MEYIGYGAAAMVGVSLGLIGGGGSILTIPLLVYLFGIDPLPATVYSLFIVGATSLVSAVAKYHAGLVNTRIMLVFGIPAIAAIFLARLWLLPAIPATVAMIGNFELTKARLLMLVFAALMIIAAVIMMTRKDLPSASKQSGFNYKAIVLQGTGTGLLTGLLGAGGGFIIIPALVMFTKLNMKQAVGTSLAIITINSLAGFAISMGEYAMDWKLLITITALAIAGGFAGNALSNRIAGGKLKKGFAWFVLATAAFIIVNELKAN